MLLTTDSKLEDSEVDELIRDLMCLGMTDSGLAAGNTQHGTMWSRELSQSQTGTE